MSKKKLNQDIVGKLSLPANKSQVIVWDADLPAFGVRVGKKSSSYIIQVEVDGQTAKQTLGRTTDIKYKDAKASAQSLLGALRLGERQPLSHVTLGKAWKIHREDCLKLGRSPLTIEDYERDIRTHLSDWISKPLHTISRSSVRKRHSDIGASHGHYAANGAMRTLRAIYNAARRSYPSLPDHPVTGLRFFKEEPRTQIIEDPRGWWKEINALSNPVRKSYFKFLAFTGCRRREAASIKWSYVNLEEQTTHLPKTKTKPFDLPLSDFLVQLLVDAREKNSVLFDGSPFVFPAASKSGHIEEPKIKGADWSPHTLRHHYCSVAETRVELPFTVARLLVNHSVGNDLHSRYVHPRIDEMIQAQQRVTDFLLDTFAA